MDCLNNKELQNAITETASAMNESTSQIGIDSMRIDTQSALKNHLKVLLDVQAKRAQDY